MELKKGGNSHSVRGPQALDKERRKRLFDIHGRKKKIASLPAGPALGRDRRRQGLRAVSRETRDGAGLCLAMTMEGNTRWMRI